MLLALLFIAIPEFAWSQSQRTDIRPNAKRIVGDALLTDFMGITHEGAYNFTDDGEPRRFYTETHHKDGRTTYIENGASADGAWIIRKEKLCFVYDHPDMQGGCFRVYKVGNCFYYYNAFIPEYADELDRDYWTARSVKQGESASCEPGLS